MTIDLALARKLLRSMPSIAAMKLARQDPDVGLPQLRALIRAAELVVVWDDGSMLRATRVTESFDWVDQVPIVLSGPTAESSPVRVAFNGTTFLVVLGATWNELIGLLVDLDGGVQDAFRIPAEHDHPSVASLGSQFLVTWHDCSSSSCRTLAVRYSPDAGVLDSPPLNLGEAVSWPRAAAAVVSDGDQYFVFWRNDAASRAVA